MNGVLCAGNKDKTNYVIIQLLLICHSQIKCQIKVRGPLCLFNRLATCSSASGIIALNIKWFTAGICTVFWQLTALWTWVGANE